MSFRIEYKELWGVEARATGVTAPLAAFRVEPTAAGRARLADHGMVARASGGRAQVFYSRNPLASEPLNGPITARVRVGFAVRVADPAAARQYLPALSSGVGPNVYAANLAADGSVNTGGGSVTSDTAVGDGEGIRIVPSVFTYKPGSVSTSDRKVVVSTIGTGDADREYDLPARDDRVTVDLAGGAVGALEVGIKTETTRTRVYADDELAGNPPVAVVELFWETRQDTVSSGGVTYALPFAKRTGA